MVQRDQGNGYRVILSLLQASSASLPHANISGPCHDLGLSLEDRDAALPP